METVRTALGKVADTISPPAGPPPGGWRENMHGAFAALNADGTILCIGYQGEWYFTRKPSWRVRIHNALIWLMSRL